MLGHSLRHFNLPLRMSGSDARPPVPATVRHLVRGRSKNDGRQHVAIGGRKGDGVDEDAFHAVSVTAISRCLAASPQRRIQLLWQGFVKQTVREL